jgi:hypothetical protein
MHAQVRMRVYARFSLSGWTYWWLVWQLTGIPVISITGNAASITSYYRWMQCALDTMNMYGFC